MDASDGSLKRIGNSIHSNVSLGNTFTEMDITLYLYEMPSESRRFITGYQHQNLSMMWNLSMSELYSTAGQEVYLHKEEEGYRLEFCDVEFANDQRTIDISGSIYLE